MVTSGVLRLKELPSLYFSSLLCRDRWQMYWKRLRFKGHCVFSGLWLYLPSADNASNRPSIHSAVDALHTAGIIHGDIALRNVVIQPAGTAILIDFDQAHISNDPKGQKMDIDAIAMLY